MPAKMHNNQTGRFPAMSSKGNQYIMVLVEVDETILMRNQWKTKQKVP